MPVQTISGKELTGLNASNISDVAQHFAGVTVKDYGGIGGLKTVSIRGLGALHTGICYDGLMMTDVQSGQIDLSRFSIENIASVVLFNGQPTDLLQPARMFASSGVLSFNSLQPAYSKALTGEVKMKVASFDTYNPSLFLNKYLSPKWSLNILANAIQSAGNYPYIEQLNSSGTNTEKKNRVNSDVKSLNSEVNSLYHFTDFESLSFKVNQYYSERGLPGTDIQYSTYSTERALEKSYMSQFLYQNKNSCYLQYQFGAKYNNSTARYSERKSTYSTLTDNTRIDHYEQNEYYLTSAFQGFPTNYLTLSASLDGWYNNLFSSSNINYYDAAKPTRQTVLGSLAAKYIHEKLTVSANLLYTFTHETNTKSDVAADRKRLTPTVSLSYQPLEDKNLRIRAFYKNIFRLPTFTDLYYNDFGYTKLSPEITNQYNLGATFAEHYSGLISELECSLDAYYNRVSDKISIMYGVPYSSVRNIGRVDIKGTDVSVKASKKINSKSDLSVNLSYTFQLAQDYTAGSATYHDIIPYTPVHSGSGALIYRFKRFEYGYNYVFSGKRYIGQNSNASNVLNPYIDQNVFTRYTFRKFSCTAEINNLFNANYDIVKYYPMPGRNYRLSVSYKL